MNHFCDNFHPISRMTTITKLIILASISHLVVTYCLL
uniref:Uncharacterized protein n=1 Tax=Anguilla anguilla TaxID=7936 RepID=A0A0E9SCM3_ANGAN